MIERVAGALAKLFEIVPPVSQHILHGPTDATNETKK